MNGLFAHPALKRQVAEMMESFAQPVYLAPPLLLRVADYAKMEREGSIPHLIDLRDPRDHPELFDSGNRFDREHMNQEGARLMSELIAEQLEPLMAEAAPKASD